MNTRLQVEHTVTEMVTGLDLVALQIRVALGEKLDLAETASTGHAIQCRINAEDPARNFLPGPGRITAYQEPSGPFVRVDSAVRTGKEIPADYDSMFAKVIVSAENRPRAIARMERALSEFHVEGVPTTIPLHRWVLGTRAFGKSSHSTTWLEKALRDAELPEGGTAPPPADTRQPVPAELLLEVDGRRVPVRIFDQRRDTAPKVPSRHSAHGGDHVHSVIAAPMQGTILRVLVEPGQEIQAGDVVCILEAMKMENAIPAPRAGVVTEIPVDAGQNVQPGDTLVELD
jgi:acetyl-CoA/propionyl-CoA carboxylase, biotin carboxylase, biotin carboxyl carrier protein